MEHVIRAPSLLDGVGEFVGEEKVTAGGARSPLPRPKKHIPPHGECPSVDRRRQPGRSTVVMDPHPRQIHPETRLEEPQRPRRQPPPPTGTDRLPRHHTRRTAISRGTQQLVLLLVHRLRRSTSSSGHPPGQRRTTNSEEGIRITRSATRSASTSKG